MFLGESVRHDGGRTTDPRCVCMIASRRRQRRAGETNRASVHKAPLYINQKETTSEQIINQGEWHGGGAGPNTKHTSAWFKFFIAACVICVRACARLCSYRAFALNVIVCVSWMVMLFVTTIELAYLCLCASVCWGMKLFVAWSTTLLSLCVRANIFLSLS